MDRDSKGLMRDLYPDAGPIPVSNPSRVKPPQNSTWVKPKTLQLFSQLSNETMQQLYKKYAFDLEFYGYSFDAETNIAKCEFEKYHCC